MLRIMALAPYSDEPQDGLGRGEAQWACFFLFVVLFFVIYLV